MLLVVFAGILGMSLAQSSPPPPLERTSSSSVAAPRTDAGILARQSDCVQLAKECAPASLVFVGDSITQGWNDGGVAMWDKHFAPIGAVNLGVSGDRTEHVLWRLQAAPITRIKPKAVVLLIGTNNIGHGTATVYETLDGTVKVIELLRAQVPDATIIACAVFPRGEQMNVMRGDALQVNQAVVRAFAGDSKVVCLDLGPKFLNPDGSIPLELMADSLHLTPKGYAVWADGIRAELAKLP